MRVDLPSGQWAEILPVEEMTREIELTLDEMLPPLLPDGTSDLTKWTQAFMNSVRDKTISLLVTAWSFEQPIPGGDPTAVMFMRRGDYKTLSDEVRPHLVELGFLKAPTEPTPSPPTSENSSD